MKLMRKLTMLRAGNTYNKPLFNLVFVGETLIHENTCHLTNIN